MAWGLRQRLFHSGTARAMRQIAICEKNGGRDFDGFGSEGSGNLGDNGAGGIEGATSYFPARLMQAS